MESQQEGNAKKQSDGTQGARESESPKPVNSEGASPPPPVNIVRANIVRERIGFSSLMLSLTGLAIEAVVLIPLLYYVHEGDLGPMFGAQGFFNVIPYAGISLIVTSVSLTGFVSSFFAFGSRCGRYALIASILALGLRFTFWSVFMNP
jgi:hypothetical protein